MFRALQMWKHFQDANRPLVVPKDVLQRQIAQIVPCVGCRRAVELGFAFLANSTHRTLQVG